MSVQCPSCFQLNDDSEVSCISCGTPLMTNSDSQSGNPSALKPGMLLGQGKYNIEKILGQGGFGITYKGVFLPNSVPVAIKELWPENAARMGSKVIWPNSISPTERQNQINKFQEEASNVQKCIHPNIVKVYDWFAENDTAYMVMNLLSGKSLDKILKEEGVLTEDRVKHYFSQIAEALKVIHANNLLHRDIKPENVIVVHPDTAILIDFGAAREFIAGQRKTMTTIGSPAYAPFEQSINSAKRFPATDLYALSASMYELLTGKLPIESAARALALSNNNSDPFIPPRQHNSQLSTLTEQVIVTGMQFKPEDRFQTAADFINALNGKFISPRQKKAHELVKQRNLSSAVQAYENLLSNEPDNGEATVELALIQIYIDDQKAELAAKKAIQLRPKDGRGYGVLGIINCHKSNWLEAVKCLQQATNLSPGEIWIQANLAWALSKSGNLQQAELVIKQVLAQDPNCMFVLGLQAWIYIKQQQWKPAIRIAAQAVFKLKQTPLSPKELLSVIYPYLICALEKSVTSQRANDVERRIEEFIAQVPDSAVAWGLKGWKKAKQGLWRDALTSFEQASKLDRVPGWVLINYAITQENMPNILGAIQVYELHAQKFSPLPLVYFRLGSLYGKTGEWEKARLYIERAIQLHTNYAAAYHNLGWILLNLRNSGGQIENMHEMLSAYRQALDLYTLQQKFPLAASIKQAFKLADLEI